MKFQLHAANETDPEPSPFKPPTERAMQTMPLTHQHIDFYIKIYILRHQISSSLEKMGAKNYSFGTRRAIVYTYRVIRAT
ncbi:hypothetical protein [Varunaivibrio sulfuroxidans]|uniref:hypothetical protein n=1 Tax=Varunaivibrio sulfuroxidans TaxID=1773489 RepID=UPI001048F8C6|nr:hypothetical protein [Varunaivibrio sulfuroxidans]WES31502.1 hypothetical protein P3M64_03795 [Varunaivibrio sulfuroxidans]